MRSGHQRQGERPAILFLHNQASRVDFRRMRYHWLAVEAGFRAFAADWPTLDFAGEKMILRHGFEILASGEARPLGKRAALKPRVILHRTPRWNDYPRLMAALEQANPGALVSYHPSWREMSTKWTAEQCFRAGEQAGTRVTRPTTYLVEKTEMRERLREAGSTSPLIFKPSAGARSSGIYLSTPETFEAVVEAVGRSEWERFVVQEVVRDPVLYKGKRFALRVFALVTSFEPLRFQFYREGIAKLAALDHDPATTGDPARLLASMAYRKRLRAPVEDVMISELVPYLAAEGYPVADFWERLEALIGNAWTCLARFPPPDEGSGGVRRFHLCGMDILMARREETFDFLFLETNYVPDLFGRSEEQDARVQRIHEQWLADLRELCDRS